MDFKRHSDATLMGMTKKELVEYVRVCEHNREVAEQTLAQHIENVKDWKPVRHGHWIEAGNYQICSECGDEHAWDEYRASYCEVCGAKMDGGAENA